MPSAAERLVTALGDRYTIERELGAGGMATVYLAKDLKHERLVAVKVLRPELTASLGSDRFLQEVKITARLSHPHILPLLDSGEADGFLYYVMPYAAGETLRDRLARERQLPIDDAVQLAREVADALNYAHTQDVIHRDIKPENILLQSGHAVVADFGIARAITVAATDRQTATGIAVGTPMYMSPEQATASRDIDGRADLYSLGCVLYEMLAGQAPFTGPTTESIVRQHVMTPPPSVTNIRPGVPAAVATAVSRALAKTPADRFNTVGEFATALSRPATESASGGRRIRSLALMGIVAVIATVAAVLLARRTTTGPAGPARTSIAVLPFENLSGAGPQAYFAGGLQNELLTQLSKLASLTVISRTSVMGYAGKNTPPRQIAKELQVGSLVEASVQTDAGRLRVNVRLIDAQTGADIWAQQYDRTFDDAFAIQSDIAQKVVAAVGAALTSRQREGLAAAPTSNDEAYRLFLQGEEYQARGGKKSWEIAQQLYERALALDPKFALAHVALSEVHGFMNLFSYDLSSARLAHQREEAETALRLAPDLPDARFAIGMVRYVALDYPRALQEFRVALEGIPSSASYTSWIGFTQRRLGLWDDVLASYERLRQLDPRAAGLFTNLGGQTYDMMHRYAEAVAVNDRALSLAPDNHVSALHRGMSYLRWRGTLDTLRVAVRETPMDASVSSFGTGAAQYVQLLFWERQTDSLLRVLPALRTPVFEGSRFFLPSALYAAWAHQLRGDRAAAHAAFDSARAVLDSMTRQHSDDWRAHAALGLALAGLGRRDDARTEAGWLRQSIVYREDAFDGPLLMEERARILAGVGDFDESLKEIERLLSRPSWLSVNMLRVDPRWDAIREQPRFKGLLTKYEVR